MGSQWSSDMVLQLLDLTDTNVISGERIETILEMLCKESGFACGFVYERDQVRVFHLFEYFGNRENRTPKAFTLDSLTPGQRAELIHCRELYVDGNKKQNAIKTALQGIFKTNILFLVPIMGDREELLGYIGLAGAKSKVIEPDALGTACRLLAKYIAPRILHKKIDYARVSLESILDHTGIDIYVNDFETHDMLYANKSMAAPYGGMRYFAGKKCFEALYDDKTEECDFCPQKKLIDDNGNPTKVYSWDYQRPFDGAWFRVFSAAFHWVDGRLAHVVSSVDITENKRNEQIISHMANYDALTELPNRRKLVADCDERISRNKTGGGFVLFLDLDGFKLVNDSLGHKAGDEMLQQLGKYFLHGAETKGNSYRNGGDEFVILLSGDKKSIAEDVARKILKRFKKPWKLTEGTVYCNTSIGIAQYPKDGKNAEELLHAADATMYLAKRSGAGNARFTGKKKNIQL
ncbi:MAG TPA: GGDEF domain-containing protein [Clostridiales bacterium]|nr:GGDEF domain-containing protein [Clostridiales bacterium]